MFSSFRRLFSAEKQKVNPECQAVPADSLTINDLPNEILSLIFINLPAETLCKKVILTCTKWKQIIDSDPFWINKMIHDSRASSNLIKVLKESNCLTDPKHLYFKNPFAKNLIKNPSAESGFDFWDTRSLIHIRNSRINKSYDYYNNEYLPKHCRNSEKIQEQNGFKIEPDSYLKKPAFDSNGEPVRNYATTYFQCSKYQLIDLYNEGIDENILTKLKPKIEIKDYYAPRHDCGSEYHINVEFYDDNFEKINGINFDKVFAQWSQPVWHEFKNVIENYSDNLRYILFEHSGKDTQFWAGHYGVKLRGSSVKLIYN